MISRYTTAEMGSVWKEENKFKKWLEVEKAVCRAQSELGIIPKKAAEDIIQRARFEIKKINEICLSIQVKNTILLKTRKKRLSL